MPPTSQTLPMPGAARATPAAREGARDGDDRPAREAREPREPREAFVLSAEAAEEQAELDQVLKEVQRNRRLDAKYKEALEIINRGARSGIATYVELGKLGADVQADPDRVYGDSAVDLLARALGYHRGTFRKAIQMVQTLPETLLRVFPNKLSRRGKLITFAHVMVVVGLPDERLRKEALDAFYRHDLSAKRLAELFHEPSAGEAPSPRSVAGALSRFKTLVGALRRQLEGGFQTNLFPRLREAQAGKPLSAEHAAQVRALGAEIDQLFAELEQARELLDLAPPEPPRGRPRRATASA
jgi:hypothetical protein